MIDHFRHQKNGHSFDVELDDVNAGDVIDG